MSINNKNVEDNIVDWRPWTRRG